jgi:teichuronic acid exporter
VGLSTEERMHARLARSVFWIVWSRGAGQIVSFLTVLLVARLLSPGDYGLMALAGVWTGMVTLLSEMGLGAAIIQFRDVDDTELNACFWLTMGAATIGYAGVYGAAPAIGAWFSAPALADVMRAIGLTLPLTAMRVVPDSLLRKRLAFDRLSQADVAAVLLNVPVVLGLALAGAGVWALVAGTLTMTVVQGVWVFGCARWWPGLRIGGARLRELLRYSLATLGSRLSWAAYQQADAFVLGRVSGDVAVGHYSMARHLAALPVSKVSVLVNQLAAPVMAELQERVVELRRSFLRAVRLVVAASLPLCVGMMLVGGDGVRVVLTEKWAEAVAPLQALAAYSILSSIAVLCVPALMARYRTGFVFRYTTAQLCVMPLAFWVGATWGGPLGVALAWATVYPIGFGWLLRETLRELEIGWRVLLAALGPAACATAVMVIAVLLVRLVSTGVIEPLPIRLAVTVATGGLAYGATFWWLAGPVRGEIVQVAGWILRGRLTSGGR